jgi:hypothetical protein
MNTKKKKQQAYPDAEERLRKSMERLGDDNPICKCCPESDPRCLERHHIAGRQFGDAIVMLCRNCHRKLSDAQYDDPPRLDNSPPEERERLGHFLLGLGNFLSRLAITLQEIGLSLINREKIFALKCSSTEGGASC